MGTERGEVHHSAAGIDVRRLPFRFRSDDTRVITLPFLPDGGPRLRGLFERVGELSDEVVEETLAAVRESHGGRHSDIEASFREHFAEAKRLLGLEVEWSPARKQLAGAFLTMEYSIESAALFNPSIVPHPNQSGLARDDCRFIMSLRATGEGHVSSIVFRTGVIDGVHDVHLDPPARLLHRSRIAPDRYFVKSLLRRKLFEMSTDRELVDRVLEPLPERFSLQELQVAVDAGRASWPERRGAEETFTSMLWLAQSNYHIDLDPKATISEIVLFPLNEVESHGLEDLRLVRFIDDDGEATYYGTYTAFNGQRTLPMLISTRDFRRLEVHSLNGACAVNKGMALFPRRIDGHFVMCTRIDGENLFISYSDHVHFWESAEQVPVPKAPWELVQIGNCGSPIETPAGWLLLTHGVGPMRTYCIGALLLDLEDPLRVVGRLREPLLRPGPEDREGYVPNVVYTCGALVHAGQLYIPFALADKSTGMAAVTLDDLLDRLVASPA